MKRGKKAQWQIGRVCRKFPFRFKAACSLSSYLSRVIYFLISLPLPSLPFSLSVWIYLVVTWAKTGGGGVQKVNKSLWWQLFPPLVSRLLLALSLSFCLLFVYSMKLLCSSPLPHPWATFPVSAPLSYHKTTSLYLFLSREAYWFYSSTNSEAPALWNYKIRKL